MRVVSAGEVLVGVSCGTFALRIDDRVRVASRILAFVDEASRTSRGIPRHGVSSVGGVAMLIDGSIGATASVSTVSGAMGGVTPFVVALKASGRMGAADSAGEAEDVVVRGGFVCRTADADIGDLRDPTDPVGRSKGDHLAERESPVLG